VDQNARRRVLAKLREDRSRKLLLQTIQRW